MSSQEQPYAPLEQLSSPEAQVFDYPALDAQTPIIRSNAPKKSSSSSVIAPSLGIEIRVQLRENLAVRPLALSSGLWKVWAKIS